MLHPEACLKIELIVWTNSGQKAVSRGKNTFKLFKTQKVRRRFKTNFSVMRKEAELQSTAVQALSAEMV